MRVATIAIKGLTPYSPSRAFQSERNDKESHEDFDKRCWREHAHTNKQGDVIIPSSAIMKGIVNSADFLAKGGFLKKVGSSKWNENFKCGLAIAASPSIGHKATEMEEPILIYAHADGNPKSGKRVWRRFPIFDQWQATFEVHILDDSIPDDVFERVIEAFGMFNGLGRWSPRVGGQNGRFTIEKLTIK